MSLRALVLAVAMLMAPRVGRAEDVGQPVIVTAAETADTAASDAVVTSAPTSDPTMLAAGVSGGLLVTTLVYGTFAWWKDAGYAPFSLYNSGFFGRTTYAGGSDKTGHFFACYWGVHLLQYLYERLGVPSENAFWLGLSVALFVSTSVELVDGFTPYGFEWNDVVANVLGISAALAAQRYPAFDALVGFRLGYVPTDHFMRHDKNYIRTINDYSGMIFYMDLKPAGLERAFGIDPGFARYFVIGPTYNTYGYSPRNRAYKEREVGVFVGLNMPEVLASVFGADSPLAVQGGRVTRYFALPFTDVSLVREMNHDSNRVNFGVANRAESRF